MAINNSKYLLIINNKTFNFLLLEKFYLILFVFFDHCLEVSFDS